VGDKEGARERLRELEEQPEINGGTAVEIACGYHWLGDDDVAYAWLERAFEARSVWMTFLHLEPRLRRLRGTQRFEELLKRIGIAPVRGRVQGVALNPIPRAVEERERNV
jgi:hypothetical protein